MLARKINLLAELIKAGVTGSTLGLATFGATDIVFAIVASDWLVALRKEYALHILTLGGGLIGIVLQLIYRD